MSSLKTVIYVLSFLAGMILEARASNYELSPQESEILFLTNKEREYAGLPPLTISSNLMEVARDHSVNMAQESHLSHDLGGNDLSKRIKNANYSYAYIGENVAESPFPIDDVMNMWLKSDGHRANILNPNFKEIGIGTAISDDGNRYYTQVFGAQ